MERATPTQLRKALELVDMMVKAGIMFVPMPAFNTKELDELVISMMAKINEIDELS